MGKDRRRIVITRVMQLATVLHQTKRGHTVSELVEKLECGRSTVYRDLNSLKHVGVGIKTETIVGETRYSLAHWPIAAIAPTPLQLAALHLARDALSSFSGTEAVKQLDQLLSQWGKLPKKQLPLKYQRPSVQSASAVAPIDRAIADRKQLEFHYRGDGDAHAKPRRVEPIELRASGEQLYLFAFDVERKDYRVFKTTRMSNFRPLREVATDHSRVDVDARFRRAVKMWTANSPTTVVVRLSPEKARFADEYPLVRDQVVTRMVDGSVEITANVNGVVEALNWVLRWGANAEAISPPEFRELAAKQLRDAAQKYTEDVFDKSNLAKTGGRRPPHDARRGLTLVGAKHVVSPKLGRRRVRVAG
jgi:proteasome accessory factor B